MTPIRLAAAAVLATAALCLTPAPAHADANPKPQGVCATVGAETTIETKHGEQRYRCEKRADDDCPRWHWQWSKSVPKGEGVTRPGEPCTTCAKPAAEVVTEVPDVVPPKTVVQPKTKPAAAAEVQELPVTGLSVPWLLAIAALLIAAGVACVAGGRRIGGRA